MEPEDLDKEQLSSIIMKDMLEKFPLVESSKLLICGTCQKLKIEEDDRKEGICYEILDIDKCIHSDPNHWKICLEDITKLKPPCIYIIKKGQQPDLKDLSMYLSNKGYVLRYISDMDAHETENNETFGLVYLRYC